MDKTNVPVPICSSSKLDWLQNKVTFRLEVCGCWAGWNHQNVKLTLWRESLRNPAWVLFPSQQDTCAQTPLPLCTPLLLYFSASLLLYPCTPVPLYSYSTLWSWESHPPLLSHHLDSRSWNSFENSRVLCCPPMQWMPTTFNLWPQESPPLFSYHWSPLFFDYLLGILLTVPEFSLHQALKSLLFMAAFIQ